MATATADKKGMKRICPSCSTRYYDFNKRPVVCPNCKTEFTAEIKVRTRRTRVANDTDEGQVAETTAIGKRGLSDDDEDEDLIAESDEGVVSLDALEEDEDDVIEDEEEGDPDLDLDEDDLDEDLEEEDDDDDFDEEDDEDEEDDAPKSRKKK